jgi:peptidyl-prolyl cis-trans isomerase A (cyclophilin A)
MKRLISLTLTLILGGVMSAQAKTATMETNKGTIEIDLYEKEAPITVANFVDLATGKKEWKDPKDGKMKKSNYYDGLIFHRVIPNFMIQGGDPTGTGMGGPGYQFQDEFSPKLQFDAPGYLAMANAGPGTNGSQFFITVAATPWLNGRHTIFGKVVKGQDVVEAISKVDRDGSDKPKSPVVIKHISIK